MMVFDFMVLFLTDSYKGVTKWLKEMEDHAAEGYVTVLVGNKSDLRHLRCVSQEQAQDFAKQKGMSFLETSALDSSNVREAFELLLKQLYQRQKSSGGAAVDDKAIKVRS